MRKPNTEEVAPFAFIDKDRPEDLRKEEEEERKDPEAYARKQAQFIVRRDHQQHRQAYAFGSAKSPSLAHLQDPQEA